MDETTSLVYLGCNLAKDLEASMPNLANQPDSISSKCNEIIRVFSSVKQRVSHGGMVLDQPQQHNTNEGLRELLRNSRSNAMDLLHAQILGERSALNVQSLTGSRVVKESEMGGRDTVGGGRALYPVGGGQIQAMDMSDSSRGVSLQRQRRRKDVGEKRSIRVPAPLMGNTEIPPEDGYTWRKYGQKEILGTRFPRAYYRCTHQKLYHCPAKKQVQRLNDNPYTFDVTYRGDHICHMSSTAPLITSTSAPLIDQQTIIHRPLPSSSFPLSHWLSMNINMTRDDHGDHQYQPVADMADFVFNSGNSSNNSMDLIFSSMETDKWDLGEKKN